MLPFTNDSSSNSVASAPSTPRSTRFQAFLHRMRSDANSKESSSAISNDDFPALLPVLPDPFEAVHPALRVHVPSSYDDSTAELSPPAPTTADLSGQFSGRFSSRFSAMAANPFQPRSSFFTRRAGLPTVLDEGGNVPFDTTAAAAAAAASSLRRNAHIGSQEDDGEDEDGTTNSASRREWPSASGGSRRKRRVRRRVVRKSNTPILFPAMASRRVRVKMFHGILLSGILLMLLITYFALLHTNASIGSFQIIFVLMFILLAIALAHTIIRLWLLVRKWNIRQRQKAEKENGYASGDVAIPVILARDEEIGIGGSPVVIEDSEEDAAKSVTHPPPAYGIWRGSVRADPNLLHWQRVQGREQPPTPEIPAECVNHPPVYTPSIQASVYSPPIQHTRRMDGGFF